MKLETLLYKPGRKQDLVFRVELHLGIIPYPFTLNTRKLDRGLSLSRAKNCADYDSSGSEPATLVAGPATLMY